MASSSRLARLPLPSISLRDKASAYDSCAALAAHMLTAYGGVQQKKYWNTVGSKPLEFLFYL